MIYNHIIKTLILNPKDDNDNIIYNYCKFYFIRNCKTSKIDKDQSLSAMSRSLSLYFIFQTIAILYSFLSGITLIKVFLFVTSIMLSILLYYRCIRFAELRYIYIFRTFYYMELCNLKNEK